jgi:hypothetical protein
MKSTTDKRVLKLAEKLEEAGIDRREIDNIMEGGDNIGKKTSPVETADWFRSAMLKMGKLLDKETCKTVRENCACCLTGNKMNSCLKIAREIDTLEERIKAVNDKKYICGSLKMTGENEITAIGDDERYKNRCVCLPAAREPLPITYCYCCGGHAKTHLQAALGVKLEGGVIASPLSSGNKNPCTFKFRIIA